MDVGHQRLQRLKGKMWGVGAWTTISNRCFTRLTPFPKIDDILTDIFSTSEVRQFDVLKWVGNDPNITASNVFHHKKPNLSDVS